MIILGVDPGIAIVGWGVIKYHLNKYTALGFGAVTTPAGMDFPARLKLVYDGISEVVSQYKPEYMAVEELFYNNNAKTVIQVAQGRGAAILACANQNMMIAEYTPLQVKQAVAGYGRADKAQVQQMAKTLLHLKAVPKPDDTADALAIAICHANSFNFNALLKG